MKNKHRKAVFSVAEKLWCAGLRGRADHIGEHPFQDRRYRLLTGRHRPDLIIYRPSKTYIVEIEVGTGLRGSILLHRINAFLELGHWVGIICHNDHLNALRWAFLLNTGSRIPHIDTEDNILGILYTELNIK